MLPSRQLLQRIRTSRKAHRVEKAVKRNLQGREMTSEPTSQHRTIEGLTKRQTPRRKVQGIAAALLPYQANGQVDVDSFQRHLISTHQVHLINAVNMDTGYVNLLTETEKHDILCWTRDALGE